MSNEPFGGLLWNSQAGVLVQATNLARRSDNANHRRERASVADRPRKTKPNVAGSGIPGPLAAVGLVFIGWVLGAALFGAIIA